LITIQLKMKIYKLHALFLTLILIFLTLLLSDTLTINVLNKIGQTENINCFDYENMKDYKKVDAKKRSYFSDQNLKSLIFEKKIFCIGKVSFKNIQLNTYNFEIIYSRSLYLILAQIIPIIIFSVTPTRLYNKFLIFNIICYELVVQVLFNFRTGFNLFNSVSISTSLILCLYIYEKQK